MTQQDRVLRYIESHGSITSMDAFMDLSITRLSAVIFNLKAKGYKFDTVTESAKNKYGEKVTFARYTLKK